MAHPYPALQAHPSSGLGDLEWAFYETEQGSFDASLGPSGVTMGAAVLVYFDRLNTALVRMLGYSWREPFTRKTGNIDDATNASPIEITSATPHGLSSGARVVISTVQGNTAANGIWFITVLSDRRFTVPGVGNGAYVAGTGTWACPAYGIMHRNLPWQHPFWNQLWVERVSKVQGIRMEGTQLMSPENLFPVVPSGAGGGFTPNTGPWTVYRLALIHLQFWRPPYYVLTDSAVIDSDTSRPQEWLRYLDKDWNINTQMLSRPGGAFLWSSNQGIPTSPGFQGSVGQKVSHLKIKRTWYQIPEACLFAPSENQMLNGLPLNMLYTQTTVINPVTAFIYPGRQWDANGVQTFEGSPTTFCVNAALGGTTTTESSNTRRMFGSYTGTLLIEGIEIKPQPLQLPPYLMAIPSIANNEPLSQTQYNVTFHFDLFDPPRPSALYALPYRGHNLMPRFADGMWYMAQTGATVAAAAPSELELPARATTAHQYIDFADFFASL